MSKLDKLLRELKESKSPVFVVALCDDCDWTGKPSDCETHEEQDGWENPSYQVAVCPKCGLDTVIWLTQEEMDGYKDV
jgi:hypothetical protein